MQTDYGDGSRKLLAVQWKAGEGLGRMLWRLVLAMQRWPD